MPIRTLPLAALAMAAALTLQAQPTPAAEAAQQDSGDRIVAGGTVRQSEPVEGDLVGVGGDVTLAAPVQGKALLAGGNVNVRDRIRGDLFAAGGNVVVSADVDGNARLAGGNVELASTAVVGRDLSAAGGEVNIRGPVTGSVHVGGGTVLIDSAVGGNVHVASGELVLGPNARISGRLVHRGANVRRDPAAQVGGGVERAVEEPRHKTTYRYPRGDGWAWTIGIVALAALLAGAFPGATRRVGGELRDHPGMALLFGFLALVCVPVAALILMITIIGLPVALVVMLLYVVLLLVGYAAAGVMLGDAALARLRAQDAERIGWRIGGAILAMLALALVGRLPFVGGLVVFAAMLLGIGAVVMALARRAAPVPA